MDYLPLYFFIAFAFLFFSGLFDVLYNRLFFSGKKGKSEYEEKTGGYWQNCVIGGNNITLPFSKHANNDAMSPLGITVRADSIILGVFERNPSIVINQKDVTRIKKISKIFYRGVRIEYVRDESRPAIADIWLDSTERLIEKLKEYNYQVSL
jgi:hypothetical protein